MININDIKIKIIIAIVIVIIILLIYYGYTKKDSLQELIGKKKSGKSEKGENEDQCDKNFDIKILFEELTNLQTQLINVD